MKRILSLLFLCSIPLAYSGTYPVPAIKDINVKYTESNNQTLYFGGRYQVNITPSQQVIFSNGMLAYIFNKEKHFVLHTDTEIEEANKNEILNAFGMNDDNSNSSLRESLNICAGTIYQYHISGMSETIIAVNSFVSGKPNSMIYLFNEISPFVERIQFLGFPDKEIEQILSTFKNTSRK